MSEAKYIALIENKFGDIIVINVSGKDKVEVVGMVSKLVELNTHRGYILMLVSKTKEVVEKINDRFLNTDR